MANKTQLLPNQKLCLSVQEAAEYSMIGENRIRRIVERAPSIDWALFVGSHLRIKRPQFERWVSDQAYI